MALIEIKPGVMAEITAMGDAAKDSASNSVSASGTESLATCVAYAQCCKQYLQLVRTYTRLVKKDAQEIEKFVRDFHTLDAQ